MPTNAAAAATVEGVYARLLALPPGPTTSSYVSAGYALLGSLIGSSDGYVVFAVQVAPPDDPLRGFRGLHAFTIGARETLHHSVTPRVMKDDSLLLGDFGIRRVFAEAGRHRTSHDPDPRQVPEMRGTLEERYWNDRRISDRLKGIYALDERHELHYGFDRFAGEPRFTADDERLIERVNRLLGPWARRVAFLHGYGPGLSPLTERESEALLILLTGEPQKNLSARLGVSQARGRELVRSLYPKLAVTRRLELMTCWMGESAAPASPPVLTEKRRRRRPAWTSLRHRPS
jgi:DNA-binding CsgD family transcriptional regulator